MTLTEGVRRAAAAATGCAPRPRPASSWRSVSAGAFLGHRLVPAVGVLTWSVGLGVVAANLERPAPPQQRALGR